MLFEMDEQTNGFKPVTGMNIIDSLGGNEEDLEEYLKETIGDLLFPEYLVFGNERAFQGEADLFAVNSGGDLIIFELKVHGHYDRGKVYQALSYAQHFSFWRYNEMNNHFKKCFPEGKELIDVFDEHFGFRIDLTEFNKRQKAIIISHSSSEDTGRISKYWQRVGVDQGNFILPKFHKKFRRLFKKVDNLSSI